MAWSWQSPVARRRDSHSALGLSPVISPNLARAWDDDYEVGEVPPSQAWSSQGWSQRAAAATKTSPFFHVANQAQAGWIDPPPAAHNHASAPMMAGAPPNSANAFDEIDDSALMGMPMDY